jgi:hypothetical protein
MGGARTCRAAGCTDVSRTLPASPPGRIPFVTPSLLHGTVTGDADLSTAAAVGCAGPPRRGLFGWVTKQPGSDDEGAPRGCGWMEVWNPREPEPGPGPRRDARRRAKSTSRVPSHLAHRSRLHLHQHARSPASVHPPAPNLTTTVLLRALCRGGLSRRSSFSRRGSLLRSVACRASTLLPAFL